MRRKQLGAIFAATILLLAVAYAGREQGPQVMVSHDLARDGQLAREQRLPLLILFSMHGCSYCDIVEDEFLRPMLISGDYDDKVIIRKVMLDSYSRLTDFDGEAIGADRLGMRYRASLTPTVVFVDGAGREMAERLVGVTTVDFYGGFLDDRIELALGRLRNLQLSARQQMFP